MLPEVPAPTAGYVAAELLAARDRVMRRMIDVGLAPHGWTVGCRARFAPTGTRFELRPVRAPIVDGVPSEISWDLGVDVVVARRTRRFEVGFTPLGDDLAVQQLVDAFFASAADGLAPRPLVPRGLPKEPF